VWADIGLGTGTYAACTALVIAIGFAFHTFSGAFFIIGAAILAWHSGFRPALVTVILATLTVTPLAQWLDSPQRVQVIDPWVRLISVFLISVIVCWLCGNLFSARQQLLVEQARLKESEGFHKLIGELAADFAFHARVDADQRVFVDAATSGVSVLLGYTVEELQNRPGLQLIHPDDRDRLAETIRRAAKGEDVRGDARVVAKSGRLVHVEYRVHSERDAGGAVTGIIGAVRDITLQREQQSALAEERQRLLVDISERQRGETELRAAKDEAERRAHEADEARAALKDREQRLHYEAQLKDEFLATLAHELRNPLAPLRNVAAILRLENLTATAKQATAVMDRQIDQLVRLIDDLMDVSRITRGQLTLKREQVDVRTILDTAVETAQPQLTSAGVSLSVEAPTRSCVLDCDATRISQIVLNLLNNAAKYTPAGGRVWLSAVAHGERVVITVRDSGIGIAPEDQERVFGMFVQLNRDLHRTQSGLGIGLTLVKQMTELHGGTVAVWSAGYGQGSEFTVTLPIVQQAQEATPPTEELLTQRPMRRILIADDSRDGADSLAYILRAAGHDVTATYDGRSAIEIAGESRPDVVLLDIGMPEVSGYDVAKAIRRESWGRGMRLIALTGWSQADHRRRSLEAGFDDHLVKPVEIDVLEEVLQVGNAAPIPSKAHPSV
jgi:PAS domain S-box-containing protein